MFKFPKIQSNGLYNQKELDKWVSAAIGNSLLCSFVVIGGLIITVDILVDKLKEAKEK